jgi:alpha-mannosidase
MFNAIDAYRRGVEQSQPLLARRAGAATPQPATLFALSSRGIVTTSVKPSTDGKAVIIRLFNAGGKPEEFRLLWKDLKPAKVYRSSVLETADEEAGESLTLPAFGIITLRCEK